MINFLHRPVHRGCSLGLREKSSGRISPQSSFQRPSRDVDSPGGEKEVRTRPLLQLSGVQDKCTAWNSLNDRTFNQLCALRQNSQRQTGIALDEPGSGFVVSVGWLMCLCVVNSTNISLCEGWKRKKIYDLWTDCCEVFYVWPFRYILGVMFLIFRGYEKPAKKIFVQKIDKYCAKCLYLPIVSHIVLIMGHHGDRCV